MDEPSLRHCARWQLRGRRHAACGPALLFLHGRFAMSAFVFCLQPALSARGFWSFYDPAMIGRHARGPSEDFGEVVKQFRLRLQLRLEATRKVRDTIGSGKAEPLGE